MRAILFSLFVSVTLAAAPGEYERGVDEGERLGRAQARAAFRSGDPDYDAAVAKAREAGYAEGRRVGASIGAARGRRRGRASAFAGFDWGIGRWYLVNIAPDGDQVRIGTRVPLRRGEWYGACAKPSGLCRRRLPTATRKS